MTTDEIYMERCLELAAQGFGAVAPNPMVGCVIVHEGNRAQAEQSSHDGKIIGEGYHKKFGGPHAEVNAVASVPENLRHLFPECTLYVSLEPCAHFGKTPPCADMLVREKFARVVIGSIDPNPKVLGAGIQKLEAAGIEVAIGILKKESDFLNRRFFTYQTKHRPYVLLKWAESADGFMAPNEPKQLWISGEQSKKLVHEWRSKEQAIMVGKNTVEIDDPELTVRLVEGKNPARVVIDRKLSLSKDKKIFRPNADVFVYNELEDGTEGNVHRVKINFENSVLEQILRHLASQEIQSLIVEGGPETLRHFIEQDLWNEAGIFTGTLVMHEGKKSPALKGTLVKTEKIGEDTLATYMRAPL